MENIEKYINRPWIKDMVRSRYMNELLEYLEVGKPLTSILSKFSDIPEEYVMGALEALEKLGLVKEVQGQESKVYVLTPDGRELLSVLKQFKESSI